MTLPAGSNDKGGVEPVRRVERPVVDDLGSLPVGRVVGLPVHHQLHVGEAHVHRVVVPFIITHLHEPHTHII